MIGFCAIYENFDRIEDRKLAIIFMSRNFPMSYWPYSIGKISRIRSRIVRASRSTEVTWFLLFLCKILFKIEFYEKFMVFHVIKIFQITNKALQRRSKQQISYILHTFKVRISHWILPMYMPFFSKSIHMTLILYKTHFNQIVLLQNM